MAEPTFREWLGDKVGDGPGRISRRELARRLASNGLSDPESHRRSIRRILEGAISPTNKTRAAIADAIGDTSFPTVEDEEEGPDMQATLMALVREQAQISRQIRKLARSVSA